MKTGRILNVGCGTDTYGTNFVDRTPLRKDVLKCDFDNEPLPYPKNMFDQVYVKGVLEHVRNNFNLLKECYRVLKPKGKIILITANAGLWGFWGSAAHGKYEKESLERSRMYAVFTPNHVKNWLESVGFKDVIVRYGDDKTTRSIRSMGVWTLSRMNSRLKPRIVAQASK